MTRWDTRWSKMSQCNRIRLGVACAAAWMACGTASAQIQTLFHEAFNTDGANTRYTVTGRGFTMGDNGPAYWHHTSAIGEVRVPGSVAPARRAAILWSHDAPADAWTDDALAIFDGVVKWALNNKANATIGFVPAVTGASDELLSQRFEDQGHSVIALGGNSADFPPPGQVDLVIHSSSGGVNPPTGFNAYNVPVITFNADNHDDIQISSIGAVVTLNPSQVKVVEANKNHPALAGRTGVVSWTQQPVSLRGIGANVPPGSTVLATYDVVTPPAVENLTKALGLINGTIPSIMASSSIPQADLAAGAAGNYGFNHPVPGAGVNGFATLGTGTLNVTGAGTYTFALGGDDGGRLRIDLNRDGNFGAGEDIIVDDSSHAFSNRFQNVTFPAVGNYGFEWIGYNNTGAFGAELAVADGPNAQDFLTGGVPMQDVFDLVGDKFLVSGVGLSGEIQVKAFYPDVVPVVSQFPAVVLVEAGGSLLGGLFTRGEGNGFFAGADLDFAFGVGGPYNTSNPRAIQFPAVDVSGKENVKLTIALAAADIDFEDTDFLRILIDKDGNGPGGFQLLTEFKGPLPKDGTVTNGSVTLHPEFQDVTFDIPGDATSLIVRIEAASTFVNEIFAFDDIRITAGVPLPFLAADFNQDGTVDLQDFNILKLFFGQPGDKSKGDATGDGLIDLQDFNVLKSQFGQSQGGPVPEPATACLALFGLACLIYHRWRRGT